MVKFSMNVDLHIHTTCSDGELSVDEVLAEARRQKLDFVGIVDHDTVEQFEKVKNSPLAAILACEGTKVWVGTEFSAKLGDMKMHLLGYNFDPTHPKIACLMQGIDDCRMRDLDYKLQLLKEQGIEFSEEQLAGFRAIKNVGKPHLARAMQDNGVPGTVHEIIQKYFTSGKKVIRVEAAEVIAAVKAAGGMVVIAHPLQIKSENKISLEQARKIWQELAGLGAKGMECFYSQYDLKQATELLEEAKRLDLVVTMGSDFHGPRVKPGIEIGKIIKE